jgi:1-acyl-sn-glycerol-3-phosphate acyltransferase
LSVDGLKNVQNVSGPVLLVSNHKSYFDPLVIAAAFPIGSKVYPLRFIAKDEFFQNIISAAVFYSMGAFPTYYGQGIDKSLQEPKRILMNKGSVVFFPEGQCIRSDKLGDGKIGAALLAMKVPGVTILPMAIYGSHRIGKIFKKAEVRVNFGEPFKLKSLAKGKTADELTELFMKRISSAYILALPNTRVKSKLRVYQT